MPETRSSEWGEWIANVVVPLRQGHPEQIPQNPDIALLSADTDRTQEYVFESARLPEIRGASMLLDNLNRELIPKRLDERFHLPPECFVYLGGGSVLALVPASRAEDVARAIEELYLDETLLATITTAIYRPATIAEFEQGLFGQELSYPRVDAILKSLAPIERNRLAEYFDPKGEHPGSFTAQQFAERGHFGQLVKWLGLELRRRKEQKVRTPFYETLPFAVRCASCNLRPASVTVREPEDQVRELCVVCERKQAGRRDAKSSWVQDFAIFLGEHADLASRYNTNQVPEAGIAVAQDIGEIAQASTRKGFIGFIYADGNGIGDYISEQRTLKDYATQSTRISEAIRQAVFQSLAEQLTIQQVRRTLPSGVRAVEIHPFEIITIGGDDVLLLVPGDAALPIAARICQLFGRYAAPLNMSAGVVIADEHNPIRFLHDLALQLKASAKSEHPGTSALDWLVLTSQSTLQTSLEGLRESPPYRLPTEQSNQWLWLTERPLTLEKTRILLKLLKQMRGARFPTSQLHALADALLDGREASSLFYIYQQARAKAERRRILQDIPQTWGLDPNLDPVPWRHVTGNGKRGGYRSFLRDLVELYDFVPERAGSEPDALWAELWDEET